MLPQPDSFKVLTPIKPEARLLRVADLIDKGDKLWCHSMIESLFLPIDTETILSMPLCPSCLRDSLMWHYSTSVELTVKSVYKFILGQKGQASSGPSLNLSHGFWKGV